MTSLHAMLASLSLLAAAARAQPGGLEAAQAEAGAGNWDRAAVAFHEAQASGSGADERLHARHLLADALRHLGLDFSGFYFDSQVVAAGPAHADFLAAVAGVAAAMERLRDEVIAPNVLEKARGDAFDRLPAEDRARVNAALALLAFRAGRLDEAQKLVDAIPAATEAPQALYLEGLILQRSDPEKALAAFHRVLALTTGRDLPPLKELSRLALGRTLFGLHRYSEASAQYAALPRFSRHWDEALFEGAYADVKEGDPGAALGKLRSLHSPHLSDEFAPESVNLEAIVYRQRCLYPQAREALARFDEVYVPMKRQIEALLASGLPLVDYFQLVRVADARLPVPLRRNLEKNERVEAMSRYLARLEAEGSALSRAQAIAASALGAELREAIAAQRAQMEQIAGKFVQGRLADRQRLLEVLQADREIIGFEVAKGEKEMIEAGFDPRARLAAQRLDRPAMPAMGHEYWPFDGEYWPDEIGYYQVTLKDACPAAKDAR